MKKILKYLGLGVIVIVVLGLLSGDKKNTPSKPSPNAYPTPTPITSNSRPFYMGFMSFPYDISFEAINRTANFNNSHADLTAHHFDAGIPWVEAYEGKTYSGDLMNNWKSKKNQYSSGPVFVAITPLNSARSDIAPYWGEKDSQPLPGEWNKYDLNAPQVKTAYLNYAKSVVEYFHPKYLAIGIEVNQLYSNARSKWNDYLELNKFVYTELKKSYPSLTVFASVQYEYMRGLNDGGSKQTKQIAELMQFSDILALSTYHYGIDYNPITPAYFKMAFDTGRPIAIAESGAMSDTIQALGVNWKGTPEDQNSFVSFLLDQAAKNKFLFVINFVPIDFDALLTKIPASAQEIAKLWVHTGLQDKSFQAKPALITWNKYLNLPKN